MVGEWKKQPVVIEIAVTTRNRFKRKTRTDIIDYNTFRNLI